MQSTGSLVDCWGFRKYLKIEVKIESLSWLYLPNEAVEETSSEGDDGNWDDLVIEVRLSLRVLSGIALKQTEDRKVKLASKTGRAGNKPAEGLRQNEGEDAGDEKENDKERYPLGRQHFRSSCDLY